MLGDLKQIADRSLIRKILDTAGAIKSTAEIWQPISKTEKSIIQAKIIRTTEQEMLFASRSNLEKIRPTQICYCYLESSKTVFKSSINFLSQHKIALDIPDYLIHKEQRKIPRIDIASENQTIYFEFGSLGFSGKVSPHAGKVLNYSHKGIAFRVARLISTSLEVGDTISCHLPSMQKRPKLGIVKHLNYLNEKHLSIGLEFI